MAELLTEVNPLVDIGRSLVPVGVDDQNVGKVRFAEGSLDVLGVTPTARPLVWAVSLPTDRGVSAFMPVGNQAGFRSVVAHPFVVLFELAKDPLGFRVADCFDCCAHFVSAFFRRKSRNTCVGYRCGKQAWSASPAR